VLAVAAAFENATEWHKQQAADSQPSTVVPALAVTDED